MTIDSKKKKYEPDITKKVVEVREEQRMYKAIAAPIDTSMPEPKTPAPKRKKMTN